MKRMITYTVLAALLSFGFSPAFAAVDSPKIPPKGVEGPDIRAKVEPKGIEGPDVRHFAKVPPKGVEGPDVR